MGFRPHPRGAQRCEGGAVRLDDTDKPGDEIAEVEATSVDEIAQPANPAMRDALRAALAPRDMDGAA